MNTRAPACSVFETRKRGSREASSPASDEEAKALGPPATDAPPSWPASASSEKVEVVLFIIPGPVKPWSSVIDLAMRAAFRSRASSLQRSKSVCSRLRRRRSRRWRVGAYERRGDAAADELLLNLSVAARKRDRSGPRALRRRRCRRARGHLHRNRSRRFPRELARGFHRESLEAFRPTDTRSRRHAPARPCASASRRLPGWPRRPGVCGRQTDCRAPWSIFRQSVRHVAVWLCCVHRPYVNAAASRSATEAARGCAAIQRRCGGP